MNKTLTQSMINVLKTGTVVYKPAGGSDRTIDAIVTRLTPGKNADGHTFTPVTVICVLNDSTDGIASDEINIGTDRIEYSVRHGQATQERAIHKITHHDEGILRLEVC